MVAGRILVTGATGFVGAALVERLVREGADVTVATRRIAETATGPAARTVTIGPIGPETEWSDALADVEAVVHLAAHVHVAPERAGQDQTFDEVNHLGTLGLYAAAARAGASLFVFMSSITVLGPESPAGSTFDDASPPAPVTAYGRSKLAAENALRREAGEGGPALVILRPPLVCGPGVKGNLAALARLAALPIPVPLGGIRNRRTLLALDNLLSAVVAVLGRPRPGTFVLGDARPLSTSEIMRHLREGARRSAVLLPLPVGLVRRAAAVLGLEGQAQRLCGDLAVDSAGFRQAYGWADAVDTATALRATAAARAG